MIDDGEEANEREPESNLVIIVYHKIAKSNYWGVGALFIGWLLRVCMVKFFVMINEASGDVNIWVNLLYLLL